MLKGKKIVLGVTASIAAYKAPLIVRLLVKEGAEVKVVMTSMAKEFISPVTLSALSGNPVFSQFFSGQDGTWNSHVELGRWADMLLIAPLTASSMGKMVNGIADNLLIATYLSAKCLVMMAPAMDLDEPASGELASGLFGKGRMEEPEVIVEKVIQYFSGNYK